ncbi:MAG: NAD(+)/NADH kinase [Saccharofermentanales bacterium]|nr:NAD(+)/NADH kinase [Eubacteriales bacterium]MDD3611287.1 NAD(+)/NADH kinase [Eubacteriales bacterium]
MRIALYPNSSRDINFATTRRLISLFDAHGATSVLEEDVAPEIAAMPGLERASYDTCDIIVCLGGDGTFISAVHRDSAYSLPITGVNLGQVGFLPEIEVEKLEVAVKRLVNKEYSIENRIMLDVSCYDAEGKRFAHDHAINDVVLARGGCPRIVTIDLEIENVPVESIPGDGIIVSTPTGSTAYSMSAGGPIVHPTMNLLLITPICPHTLHNRTYIADAETTVSLKLQQYPNCATLSVDGRSHYDIYHNDRVEIACSKHAFRFIRIWEDKFFQTLPEKIQKRGLV